MADSTPSVTVEYSSSRRRNAVAITITSLLGFLRGVQDGLVDGVVLALGSIFLLALLAGLVWLFSVGMDRRSRRLGRAKVSGSLILLTERTELVSVQGLNPPIFEADGQLCVDKDGLVFEPRGRDYRRKHLRLMIPWQSVDEVTCKVDNAFRAGLDLEIKGGQEGVSPEVLAADALAEAFSLDENDARWQLIDTADELRWEAFFTARPVNGIPGVLLRLQDQFAKAPVREIGTFPKWEQKHE